MGRLMGEMEWRKGGEEVGKKLMGHETDGNKGQMGVFKEDGLARDSKSRCEHMEFVDNIFKIFSENLVKI